MGLIHWFTQPGASTQHQSHGELAPLVVASPPDRTAAVVRQAVATLPGWPVVSEVAGELRLARGVGLGYSVIVTLKPAGPGTMIHATSSSRLGFSRPGQNRCNILELFAAIRRSSRVIEEQ